MNRRAAALAAFTTLTWLALASTAVAQPDLGVGDLIGTIHYGNVNGIAGYSVGTEVCNLGDESSDWIANTNRHPVIAQNIYRHDDGRIEQLGLGWLKHGFVAINGDACGLGCRGGGGGLGPGCSDPYSAGLNGNQSGMGPRFEVNASTGVFPYPPTDGDRTGNAIFKRVQVRVADIDPSLNPDARYFVEGQYVTQDEAQAGNGANSVSYREVSVEPDLDLRFEAPTVRGVGAIRAWQAIDPGVEIADIDIPNDGRMTIASRATNLGGGLWHYEYAVHNNNSHRSGRMLEVLVPSGVTVSNIGFHDVDYHSGEPFAGTDWAATSSDGSVSWATDPFGVDPAANALRWGSMYNYRFDADAPPASSTAEMTLFRPGTPASWSTLVIGPNNRTGEPLLNVAGACPGETALALENLTPGGSTAIVGGSGPGVTTIPQGPCAGIDLEIADGELVTILTAGDNGEIALSRGLGGAFCGASLQAVDLATCDLSNVVELPE